MRRGTLTHAEAQEYGSDEVVVLLVADKDECLGHMVRKLGEAFHCLGTGSVDAGDVDSEVALEVGDRDREWIDAVGFGVGGCCGMVVSWPYWKREEWRRKF